MTKAETVAEEWVVPLESPRLAQRFLEREDHVAQFRGLFEFVLRRRVRTLWAALRTLRIGSRPRRVIALNRLSV